MPSHPWSSRTIVASIVVALVAVGGFLWWQQGRAPSRSEVAAFLDRVAGGGRVRFTVTALTSRSSGAEIRELAVEASARNELPLFEKADAGEQLARAAALEPAVRAEARRILDEPADARTPEFRAAGPFPADPFRATILRETTRAGTTFPFAGIVEARRVDGSWNLALLSGGFSAAVPAGEVKAHFGADTLALGDPVDEARWRALVTDFAAFAGRVGGIRAKLDAARSAALETRRRAFLEQIAPGRVWRGSAVAAASQQATPLYLEIVAVGPDGEVTAALHNDGSWHVGRMFRGSWKADDAFEQPGLNLTSTADQAVRGAGPFVENAQLWTFALRADARGEFSEQGKYFSYHFAVMPPQEAEALRTRLEEEFVAARAAAAPGSLFVGTATARNSGAAEPVLLRFDRQGGGGEAIEAKIESTTRAWKRSLRGGLVANTRRSGGMPIRLRTGPGDAAADAPAGSVLSDPGELELRLGLQSGGLAGGDERYTYRFKVAGSEELAQLEGERRERARRFGAVVRPGIVYDGTMRSDRADMGKVRLELTRADPGTGEVALRVHMLAHLGVYREFVGHSDARDGSMLVDATERGVLDKTIGYELPFFLTPLTSRVRFEFTGGALAGRIEGDAHWTMDFPVEVLLRAPGETASPETAAQEGAVLPAWPEKEGAYLFHEGGWISLVANQGHVVTQPVERRESRGEDDDELIPPTNIVGLVGLGVSELIKLSRKKGDKEGPQTESFLEFSGKESPPGNQGAPIIVVFVGDAPGEAALELVPAEVLPDGRRRVRLGHGETPGFHWGERRVAAYVRKAGPKVTLLTTTVVPGPGVYVLNVGGGIEVKQE